MRTPPHLCGIIVLISLFLLLPTPMWAADQSTPPDTQASVFISVPPTLTLEDCVDIALQENRALNQSRTRIKAATARKEAVTATQFPSATALTQRTQLDRPRTTSSRNTQEVHRIIITESVQPFGRFRALRRATQAGIKAADAEARRVEIDVAFQVTRAFYDVILAEQLRKVASESVDQLTRHRDKTAALVEAGSTPRFDLIRAEVQLAAAMPALIKATHAIANHLADLLNVMGLDPTANPEISGNLPEAVPDRLPLQEAEALQTAKNRRPDLQSAMAAADAARFSLSATRKALQPSVQISQILEQNRGVSAPLTGYNDVRTTQVGLVFPFLDSGLSRAQTREAAANHDQARIGYENTLSTLHIEVRKAISALTESFEVLKSQEKNVEQAQEALSIAEKAYQTGAKTSLDVLDAQVALTQARTLRYQALRDRAVALSQFEKALGLMPGFFFLQEAKAQAPESTPQ